MANSKSHSIWVCYDSSSKVLMGILEQANCRCGAPRCDITHLLNECEFFGVRPTNEDITAMNDNTTKWMTDVADTI